MESEFLFNLKEISIQVIVISILVFGLTMLIKWPIKKYTEKFEENKRKAINTVIVFIPMLLSLILSVLYYGIFEKEWFTEVVFETMGSSYLLAVAVYAIYSRIVNIVKGTKTQVENEDLSKETITFLKENIKNISKTIKTDEKKLTNIVIEIEKLLSVKDEIISNINFQDISSVEKLDNQIKQLEAQKQTLTSSISVQQSELESYQKTLKGKGESNG